MDNAPQALLYSAALGTLPRRHFEVKAKVDPPRMRIAILLGLLVIVGIGGGAAGCVPLEARPAPFRARPDSIVRGDLRGPFSGRVLDGDTDRPVTGALVYASWRFVEGAGLTAPHGYSEWIGSTDSLGLYKVPRLDSSSRENRLADFHLVVYKRGYVAYRSDRRFDDLGPRTEFSQMGATVTLVRWRPEMSHAKHLRYIGGGPALAALTSWEVPDAVAELSGAKPGTGGEKERLAELPPSERLDASKLLAPSDIKQLTGFEGAFDAAELGDEPPSDHYDTVHLQARGKDETYDVALRLWRYPPADATKQYDRLTRELPGAQAKNGIGDRSLRASTPAGDILGLAFLDSKRGIVVLIQCGASQCRTHETVLGIARIILSRAAAIFPVQGGAK